MSRLSSWSSRWRVIGALALIGAAWFAASAPGSGPTPHSVRLLHRQPDVEKIGFRLEQFSPEAWVETGDDYFCPQGHLHFRHDPVSEEIWILERPELDGVRLPLALAGLPQVELPTDGRLLLHWESGVEVLHLENAAYFGLQAEPGSRLSRLLDFEHHPPSGDHADAALERIRATVTEHDSSLSRHEQELDRAGPGFLEIDVLAERAVFAAAGELRSGPGDGRGTLCVGLDDAGDFWFWYE